MASHCGFGSWGGGGPAEATGADGMNGQRDQLENTNERRHHQIILGLPVEPTGPNETMDSILWIP